MMSKKIQRMIRILYSYDVSVLDDIYVDMYAFIKQILPSRFYQWYIDYLSLKSITIKNELYITVEQCIKILGKTTSIKCREIYGSINSSDKMIDHDLKIFNIDGCSFTSFFVDDVDEGRKIWIFAKQITDFLGYAYGKTAVRVHVKKNNKMNLLELINSYRCLKKSQYVMIDKQTMFINQYGLNDLLMGCRKPNAISIAKNLNIDISRKKIYDESDVLEYLISFFKSSNIKYLMQYSVKNENNNNYRIDCYLPKYKIAIEIDEHGHCDRDRDPIYERKRQKYIESKLKCIFVRMNPHHVDFDIFSVIGQIHKLIIDIFIDRDDF